MINFAFNFNFVAKFVKHLVFGSSRIICLKGGVFTITKILYTAHSQ